MDNKGQTFIEAVVALIIIFAVSIFLSLITTLFYDGLIEFFVFLGWLFLLCTIVFGFVLDMNVGNREIFISGGASAVFFFISWAIPKMSSIKLFP